MRTALTFVSLLCLTGIAPVSLAQTQPGVTQTVATLSLSGPGGAHATIGAAELQALPRQTVKVHNAHSGADETYQGVELSTLLARLQAPLGAKLHGPALAMYVVAEGADKYRAVYSLAEVDPAFHSGIVIVADSQDGKADRGQRRPLQASEYGGQAASPLGAQPRLRATVGGSAR